MIIADFWEEGGGGLELSIRASDEVLAVLVKFVHSGSVSLPSSLELRLELLRVAEELEMRALAAAVLGAVQLDLTQDSAEIALEYSQQCGLKHLEDACVAFLRDGHRHQSAVAYSSAPSLFDLAEGQAGPHGAFDRTSNVALRDAIFSSLQEVSAALSEPAAGRRGGSASKTLSAAHGNSPAPQSRDTSTPAWCEPEPYEEQVHGYAAPVDREEEEEEEEWGANFSVESAVASGRPQSSMRSGSGGIYGLLLRNQSAAEIAPASRQKSTRPGVPGKVMGEKSRGAFGGSAVRAPQQQKQPNGPQDRKAASQHDRQGSKSSAVGSAQEVTPRSKRAGDLLAGARPSAAVFPRSSWTDDWASDNRLSDLDDCCPDADLSMVSAEAREFAADMSLEPQRERSVAEIK